MASSDENPAFSHRKSLQYKQKHLLTSFLHLWTESLQVLGTGPAFAQLSTAMQTGGQPGSFSWTIAVVDPAILLSTLSSSFCLFKRVFPTTTDLKTSKIS